MSCEPSNEQYADALFAHSGASNNIPLAGQYAKFDNIVQWAGQPASLKAVMTLFTVDQSSIADVTYTPVGQETKDVNFMINDVISNASDVTNAYAFQGLKSQLAYKAFKNVFNSGNTDTDLPGSTDGNGADMPVANVSATNTSWNFSTAAILGASNVGSLGLTTYYQTNQSFQNFLTYLSIQNGFGSCWTDPVNGLQNIKYLNTSNLKYRLINDGTAVDISGGKTTSVTVDAGKTLTLKVLKPGDADYTSSLNLSLAQSDYMVFANVEDVYSAIERNNIQLSNGDLNGVEGLTLAIATQLLYGGVLDFDSKAQITDLYATSASDKNIALAWIDLTDATTPTPKTTPQKKLALTTNIVNPPSNPFVWGVFTAGGFQDLLNNLQSSQSLKEIVDDWTEAESSDANYKKLLGTYQTVPSSEELVALTVQYENAGASPGDVISFKNQTENYQTSNPLYFSGLTTVDNIKTAISCYGLRQALSKAASGTITNNFGTLVSLIARMYTGLDGANAMIPGFVKATSDISIFTQAMNDLCTESPSETTPITQSEAMAQLLGSTAFAGLTDGTVNDNVSTELASNPYLNGQGDSFKLFMAVSGYSSGLPTLGVAVVNSLNTSAIKFFDVEANRPNAQLLVRTETDGSLLANGESVLSNDVIVSISNSTVRAYYFTASTNTFVPTLADNTYDVLKTKSSMSNDQLITAWMNDNTARRISFNGNAATVGASTLDNLNDLIDEFGMSPVLNLASSLVSKSGTGVISSVLQAVPQSDGLALAALLVNNGTPTVNSSNNPVGMLGTTVMADVIAGKISSTAVGNLTEQVANYCSESLNKCAQSAEFVSKIVEVYMATTQTANYVFSDTNDERRMEQFVALLMALKSDTLLANCIEGVGAEVGPIIDAMLITGSNLPSVANDGPVGVALANLTTTMSKVQTLNNVNFATNVISKIDSTNILHKIDVIATNNSGINDVTRNWFMVLLKQYNRTSAFFEYIMTEPNYNALVSYIPQARLMNLIYEAYSVKEGSFTEVIESLAFVVARCPSTGLPVFPTYFLNTPTFPSDACQ